MRKRATDLEGYMVMGERERTLGPVESFWLDEETGRPVFASVKTGFIRSRERVVPLHHARLDEEHRRLHVPYPIGLVRSAPAFPASHRLTPDEERRVLAHYAQAPAGTTLGRTPAPPEDILLRREAVDVDKRVVQAGTVRLRKVVRTKVVQQPVEIRYEEIVVERLPAGEAAPRHGAVGSLPREPFAEGELVLPEYAEEPVITKRAEVAGALRARKVVETREDTIRAAVRREDVEVERLPARTDWPPRGPMDE